MLQDTGVHIGEQWRIASEIFILLVLGMKDPKANAELISTLQKQQQSLRLRQQRNQDCATYAANLTFKTTAQAIKITLVTISRVYHSHGKITKEKITSKHFMTIGQQ